jgi:hypothetical protein
VTDRRELQAELVTLAVIFGGVALGLWFGPSRLVVTPTNLNVFRIMPDVVTVDAARISWGVVFAGCTIALLMLMWWQHVIAQFIAVGVVGFTSGTWLAAYTLPLTVGRGSIIGSIIFTTLLLWPGYVIYRIARGVGE